MKKAILLYFLLFGLYLQGHSQFCTTYPDPKSGSTAKIGVVQIAGNISNKGTAVVFMSMKDSVMFNYTFYSNNAAENFFIPKMYCLIHFKDGSTKKLMASKESIVAPRDKGTQIGFMSLIDSNDINEFHLKPISSLDFCYNGNDSDVEVLTIRNDKATQIMKATDCIKSGE